MIERIEPPDARAYVPVRKLIDRAILLGDRSVSVTPTLHEWAETYGTVPIIGLRRSEASHMGRFAAAGYVGLALEAQGYGDSVNAFLNTQGALRIDGADDLIPRRSTKPGGKLSHGDFIEAHKISQSSAESIQQDETSMERLAVQLEVLQSPLTVLLRPDRTIGPGPQELFEIIPRLPEDENRRMEMAREVTTYAIRAAAEALVT